MADDAVTMTNTPCFDCGTPLTAAVYTTGPEAWCDGCGKKYDFVRVESDDPNIASFQIVAAGAA